MNSNHFLHTAIKASLQAGEAIMHVYEQEEFFIEFKKDDSPVTIADKKANAIITEKLKVIDIPIISEESEQLPYEERKKWDTCWMVDPLDGTKEFIKRNGEFTVNIALIKKGKPELGVIYIPNTKTIYFATIAEKKAYKTILANHGTIVEEVLQNALEISPKIDKKVLKVVSSRSYKNQPQLVNFITAAKERYEEVQFIAAGSSLKFCLVAEGKASVYPRYAPTMEWDTAAGQAICNAVGVEIISMRNSSPLTYNKEYLTNPFFITIRK